MLIVHESVQRHLNYCQQRDLSAHRNDLGRAAVSLELGPCARTAHHWIHWYCLVLCLREDLVWAYCMCSVVLRNGTFIEPRRSRAFCSPTAPYSVGEFSLVPLLLAISDAILALLAHFSTALSL